MERLIKDILECANYMLHVLSSKDKNEKDHLMRLTCGTLSKVQTAIFEEIEKNEKEES